MALPAGDVTFAPELIAFRVGGRLGMRLKAAPFGRTWMDETNERFAYRCLPLTIANQAGWFVLNSHPLRVCWDGGTDPAALRIMYLAGTPPYPATSIFGHGILTFHIPYLFRTPPGYNLLARGPANAPKDGISPLEGLIETDWAVATFTMNWKLTRPDQVVTFEEGEPVCMVVPQRRGDLEAFHPRIVDVDNEPALAASHTRWAESRRRFMIRLRMTRGPAGKGSWQRHYFQGAAPDGTRAPAHQTRLKLRPFTESD